jgi:mono/diheme cytochrome c family protein
MQTPPLNLLQAIATLLAALAFALVIGLIGLWSWLPDQTQASRTNTTVAASAGPVYDEQKAMAAGLEQSPTGKQLFVGNCKQCHAINEVVVGPALGNLSERRSNDWIQAFIRNSSKMIQNGDPIAKELYEQYNRTQMPSFNFKQEEMDAILSYIKFESAAYGM